MRNEGDKPWPEKTLLVKTKGELGGDSMLVPVVKPGEEIDLSVRITAPQ